MTGKLRPIWEIENFSGVYIPKVHGAVKPLKHGYYQIIDVPLAGDAPKHFIRAYKYGGTCKRTRPSTWPFYIAKVGHKWYPMESVTEYVLNRLGTFFGVRMAESDLRLIHVQIRFLSRYFLRKDESLIHGAQIYSTYLDESDETFVEEIEDAQLSREWLTFQLTIKAIERMFPEYHKPLIQEFLKMLVFDAIIGNNDRHFYNWGIIIDVKGKRPPRFSPVYDTARGLFWNFSEEGILGMYSQPHEPIKPSFTKYIYGSMPKIGWDGRKKINHFELVELIYQSYPSYQEICKELLNDVHLEQAMNWLKTDCKTLFSYVRLALIQNCLKIRFEKLRGICDI